MTLYGYARVSSQDQNPQLQFDALDAAGIDSERIYSDRVSGTHDARPGLTAVLSELQAGDTLIVWRLDRLGRSTTHLIRTVEDLGERGVEFRSLNDALDTTTPGGRLVFRLMASLAEFERDIIAERTNAGLAAAKARGVQLGRPKSLDPSAIATIHWLYHERGQTMKAIATQFQVSRFTISRALAEPPER